MKRAAAPAHATIAGPVTCLAFARVDEVIAVIEETSEL